MMVSSFHNGRSQAIPVSLAMMPIPMANTANTNTNNSVTDATIYNNYQQQQQHTRRKRKADSQDTNNERLSKRLSLLNLEQNGAKLYVPVEQTQLPCSTRQPPTSTTTANNAPPTIATTATTGDEVMHLDDTSNKVYIYNLDDELSSESEPDDPEGKLVFLPDVEKHLRANRIIPGVTGGSSTDAVGGSVVPRPILPNRDGELAGMQLVLYNEGPSSLTVPEEHDSVRKAIIEARARVRQRQQEEREAREVAMNPLLGVRTASFATPVRVVAPSAVPMAAAVPEEEVMGGASSRMAPVPLINNDNNDAGEDDADAMDID